MNWRHLATTSSPHLEDFILRALNGLKCKSDMRDHSVRCIEWDLDGDKIRVKTCKGLL